MVNEARIVSQLAVVSISVVLLAACDTPVESPTTGTVENTSETAQTRVYFGDTHLHTALSFDAGSFGNHLGPDEVYRFTKGAKVTSSAGVDAQGNRLDAQLRRPLDFVVVADHSDGLGFFQMIQSGDPVIMENNQTRKWHEMINAGGQEAVSATLEMIGAFSQDKFPMQTNDPDLMWPIWKDIVANAREIQRSREIYGLCGPTRTLTETSGLFTTYASLRFRHPDGQLTKRCVTDWICRLRCT